jgi:hypothetical protein
VWALAGSGLAAWIAPSFGDIFLENSFKNGIAALVLPPARVATSRAARRNPGAPHHRPDRADRALPRRRPGALRRGRKGVPAEGRRQIDLTRARRGDRRLGSPAGADMPGCRGASWRGAGGAEPGIDAAWVPGRLSRPRVARPSRLPASSDGELERMASACRSTA